MTDHHTRETCRACGGRDLRRFLSLGPSALANAFLCSPQEFAAERAYPLDVYFCEDCSLVQLLDVIRPDILFHDYIYVTGTSDTMALHNNEYAATLVSLLNLESKDLAIDIGSNDGSLLKCLAARGVRVLGIEPATNIAEIARRNGITTINQFFDSAIVPQVLAGYGPAKVITGNNVFAHVDQSQDFLRGCHNLLAPGGLVVIEAPYVRDMLDRLEYDTIYHEHLCYFSVTALMRLCETVQMSIVRVDHVSVHGGSLRMYAARREDCPAHAASVLALAAEERRAGLSEFSRYERFAADVASHRQATRSFLEDLRRAGRSVAGYGAPAKGNTFLNFCRIDTQRLPYIVDKSPLKVGRYTPGMHIPVLPVSTLLDRQPDYVLILAWNFADEIVQQQDEYRRRGGRFVTAIPEPKVV